MTAEERFNQRPRRDENNPPPFRPDERKGPAPRPTPPREQAGSRGLPRPAVAAQPTAAQRPAQRPGAVPQRPLPPARQMPGKQQRPAQPGAGRMPAAAPAGAAAFRPQPQAGRKTPLHDGQPPRPSVYRPAGQGQPSMGPAEAARRAAEASYRMSGEAFPSAFHENESEGLPEQNRFADEFFTGDDAEELRSGRSYRVLIIGISAAAVLFLLLSIFFLFRTFSRRNDVRMAKRETTTAAAQPTTATTPTPAPTTRKPTEQTTLTPPGTDPYANVPAWTPPTAAATLPPEQVAPPPVVNEITAESSAEASSQNNVEAPPSVEIPLPGPTESSSAAAAAIPENAGIALPSLAQGVNPAVPAPASPDISLPRDDAALISPEEARLRLGEQLANGFAEVYASPSGRYYFGKSRDDGFYYLLDITVGGKAVQLPMHAPEKLGQMAGDKGFGYIMDHQLYHLTYEDAKVTLILPDVQDALLADDAASFLVKKNNGAYLADSSGNLIELVVPGSVTGELKLLTVAADASFAVFQDQANIFVYTLNGPPPGNVLSIERDGAGDARVLRSSDGSQSIIYESDSSVLVRLDKEQVSQIQLSAGVLSEDALVLPAGNSSTGPYGRLAIFSNNTLYVANEKISAGNGLFSAAAVAGGIESLCAGGDALFYTDDQQRGLHVLDVSAVGEGLDAMLLVASDVEDVCCTADGSAVYYRQNGQLWRRLSGGTAERVYEDCAAFMIDQNGQRIVIITKQGGLVRIARGMAEELMPAGSGINADSLAGNRSVRGGGNVWLSEEPLVWSVQGQNFREP